MDMFISKLMDEGMQAKAISLQKNILTSITSLLVVSLLSIPLLLTACAAQEDPIPVTLKLNWEAGMDFLGFYVALEKGYYIEEGLAVTIEPLSDSPEGSDIPYEVSEGKYEFAIGVGDAQRAQAAGVPITQFASFYKLAPTAFFARAETGIQTPADLAGHTIVVKNVAWENILIDTLEHGGLTIEDVTPVPGGFDMSPFLDGEVEVWAGFITDEVVRARMAGLDLVTIPLHEFGRRRQGVTVYTSQDFLQNNRDLAVRFLRASMRGWESAVNNPSDGVDAFLELFPDKVDEREFYLLSFQSAIPLILPGGETIGEIDCDQWNADDRFVDMSSTATLCTTEVFEAASK